MSNKVKQTIDFDRLCKLFGVETIDDWSETICSIDFGYAYDCAIELGNTENEAQALAEQAERKEIERATNQYRDAVLYAAEKLFGEHELELVPLKGSAWDWKIVPKTTWKEVAYKIIDTVNGVGIFRFDSLKDFLESGPYTEREAVLSHIVWIPARYEVYNGGKAKNLIMRRLRQY